MLDRERQQHDVELAVDQFVQQLLRLRLAQVQIEIGIGRADERQELRQQIGRNGGNGAEAKRAGEAAGELACTVEKIVDVGQHAGRTLGDLATARRQADALARALQQLQAEFLLQLLDLHGEGRLRHGALLCRHPEMAGLRHRAEIPKLFDRDH